MEEIRQIIHIIWDFFLIIIILTLPFIYFFKKKKWKNDINDINEFLMYEKWIDTSPIWIKSNISCYNFINSWEDYNSYISSKKHILFLFPTIFLILFIIPLTLIICYLLFNNNIIIWVVLLFILIGIIFTLINEMKKEYRDVKIDYLNKEINRNWYIYSFDEILSIQLNTYIVERKQNDTAALDSSYNNTELNIVLNTKNKKWKYNRINLAADSNPENIVSFAWYISSKMEKELINVSESINCINNMFN